jgi:hypothetical protein
MKIDDNIDSTERTKQLENLWFKPSEDQKQKPQTPPTPEKPAHVENFA